MGDDVEFAPCPRQRACPSPGEQRQHDDDEAVVAEETARVMPAALQLTLFAAEPDPLVDELKSLAADEFTPLEALTKLYELQRRAREG